MQMLLKIEANEITYLEHLSYYNNICYELKKPFMGLTHFIEKYDDVNMCPDCIFGVVVNGKFKEMLHGEMDRGIDEVYKGFGGVWYNVYVNYPQQYFKEDNAECKSNSSN